MNNSQFRHLSNDEKGHVAKKLNLPDLKRLSQVSSNMKNISIPFVRAKLKEQNTQMMTDMMKVSRLSPQPLALSTWNKSKLAAYISAYHHHNAAWPENFFDGAGYGGNERTYMYMHPDGSIRSRWMGMENFNKHPRHVPSGTVRPNVRTYLTSGAPLKTHNKFKLYKALMRQNKNELVLLAQMIHGIIYNNNNNNNSEVELNVDELAVPQFGQKWRRLSRIAPKAGKIGRYVRGVHDNALKKTYHG